MNIILTEPTIDHIAQRYQETDTQYNFEQYLSAYLHVMTRNIKPKQPVTGPVKSDRRFDWKV